ncbi:MAG: heparinase II/III family protein [Kiritimatiellae bacterium]|nr:heparinase II/III family protein [Kiritimatiellia bacterium]
MTNQIKRHFLAAGIFLAAFGGAEAGSELRAQPRIDLGHPRLFFEAKDLDELRRRAKDDSVDAVGISPKALWAAIEKSAEAALAASVVEKDNPESVYGRREYIYRQVMSRMQSLGMAFAVTGQDKYLEGLRRDIAQVLGWPDWGQTQAVFGIVGITAGLAFVYDVAYDRLSPDERRRIEDDLVGKGLSKLMPTVSPEVGNISLYKANCAGQGALVLLGNPRFPQASEWADKARDTIETILKKCSRDGSWAEGVGYSTLGVEHALQFAEATARVTGDRRILGAEHLRNLTQFALYTLTPDGSGGVGFCDTWQGSGHHLAVFRLAKHFNDGIGMWYVQRAGWKGGEGIFPFLFYHRDVQPVSPQGKLPLSKRFGDIGWVVMRSSWEDPDGMLMAFKSGPSGHHTHNDQNHFELHAFRSCLATSPGYGHYRVFRSDSFGHNTVLVDGQSQVCSEVTHPPAIFPEMAGKITDFLTSDVLDYAVGSAPSYGRKDRRKGEVLRIELTPGDKPVLRVKPEKSEPAELEMFPYKEEFKTIFAYGPSARLPEKRLHFFLGKGDEPKLRVAEEPGDPEPLALSRQGAVWTGDYQSIYPVVVDPSLDRFDRHLLYVRPGYFVVFDDLAGRGEAARSFSWLLQVSRAHCITQKGRFDIRGDSIVSVPTEVIGRKSPPAGELFVKVLLPGPGEFTAESKMFREPAFDETYGPYLEVSNKAKLKSANFLALLWPRLKGAPDPDIRSLEVGGGHGVEVRSADRRDTFLFRTTAKEAVKAEKVVVDGQIGMVSADAAGKVGRWALLRGRSLRYAGEELVGAETLVNGVFWRDGQGAWQGKCRTSEDCDLRLGVPNADKVTAGGKELSARRLPSGALSVHLAAGEHELSVLLKP